MLAHGDLFVARTHTSNPLPGRVPDGHHAISYASPGGYMASITTTYTQHDTTAIEQARPGGLAATYYSSALAFGGDAEGADAPVPTIDWSSGSASVGTIGPASANWTGGGARWSGYIRPRYPGAVHTFSGAVKSAAERVRIWIDGLLLVDQWSSLTSTGFSASSSLQEGLGLPLYRISVDYAHAGPTPRGLFLHWTTAADPTTPHVVPSASLFYGVPLPGGALPTLVSPASVCASRSFASGLSLLTAGVRSAFTLVAKDAFGNNRPASEPPLSGGGLVLEAQNMQSGCPSWHKQSAAGGGVTASPTFTLAGGYTLSASTTAAGDGGLQAVYYSDAFRLSPRCSRIDSAVSFDWGSSTSPCPEIPPGGAFGALWTGFIEAPVTGDYVFSIVSDSGADLTVAGELLITFTGGLGSRLSSSFFMEEGIRYPVRVSYESTAAPAYIQIRWSSPPHVPDQAVPASALFPPGVPLSNSPLALRVVPAVIAPRLTTCRGDGLTSTTAGSVTSFIVLSRDAFLNPTEGEAIAVKIEVGGGGGGERFRHASVSRSLSGQTIFSYTVTQAGLNTIHAVSLAVGGLKATYYSDAGLLPASAVGSSVDAGGVCHSPLC